MRYERDESSLRQKQDELDKARDDIAIAALEKQKQAIQDTIDALNKQKESIQEMMEESSKYYEKMIKEQEKMFDEMVKNLEKTKSKWEELAEVDEISKAWGLVSEHMEGLGYTIDDVLNGNDEAFNAFKDEYINVLAEMHKGDEHYLQGLQETTGKIPGQLGEVAGAATEATEPVKALASSASTASTNVGTLGTKATTAASGVKDLKESSDGVADNLNKLNDVKVDGLISGPLTDLEGELDKLKGLIDGDNSIKSAFESLNNLNLDTIYMAFLNLADAVRDVAAAIGTGGGDEEQTYGAAGKHGKNGMPSSGIPTSAITGGTGEGLVGAINSVKDATDMAIGNSSEEGGEKAIGAFNALKDAVNKVTEAIGQGGENVPKEAIGDGTLVSAIASLQPTTELALRGENGVIEMFSELQGTLEQCASFAKELVTAISSLSGMNIPSFEGITVVNGLAFGLGKATGTAIPHAEGTAKYDGDWGIKHNEKALTGELGPEILLRDGKYHILGKNGPEFVDLKKDDVILNHKQSAQVLSKKNKVGPSHADGTLPNGFFRFVEDSSITALRTKIKEAGLPTLDGIKSALQAQTEAIKSEVRNIVNSTSSATTVNQSNTFNISGVSGEDVARQINTTLVNTFSGMSLNAYQRSMA